MRKLIVCNIAERGPGVLGDGVRGFEARPPGSLRLLGTRTFDDSSLLLTRYAVGR